MDKWQERNRPIRLERRFEFETYHETRDFLDRLGTLSESKRIFPDISFGKTYVNITLRPESETQDSPLTEVEKVKLKARPANWRLACQTIVKSSVIILTKPQSPPLNAKALIESAKSAPLA